MLRVQEAPAADGLPALVGRGRGPLSELRKAGQRGEVGVRPVGLQGHDGADQGGRGGEGEHVLAGLSNAGEDFGFGLCRSLTLVGVGHVVIGRDAVVGDELDRGEIQPRFENRTPFVH